MKIAQAQSPTSLRWLHPTRLNMDCFGGKPPRNDDNRGRAGLLRPLCGLAMTNGVEMDRHAVARDDDSGERTLASWSFQKKITDYHSCEVFLLNEK